MLTGLVMIAVNKTVLELATSRNSLTPIVAKDDSVSYFRRRINSYNNYITDKIDWVDYGYLAREANRTGSGERGKPTILSADQVELSKTMADGYSYNVLTSDMISLDRSLPDFRHEG